MKLLGIIATCVVIVSAVVADVITIIELLHEYGH